MFLVNYCWISGRQSLLFSISKNKIDHIPLMLPTLHKKWSFPLRIFSVNVTNSKGNCGFGHIYWRNPQWKTSFFVQCQIQINNQAIKKDEYVRFFGCITRGIFVMEKRHIKSIENKVSKNIDVLYKAHHFEDQNFLDWTKKIFTYRNPNNLYSKGADSKCFINHKVRSF